MSWIKESNRPWNLKIGFWSAFFGTIIAAIEVAIALEGKDCQKDEYNQGVSPWYWNWRNWDWLDFWATIIGGIGGQITQLAIIYLTWRYLS